MIAVDSLGPDADGQPFHGQALVANEVVVLAVVLYSLRWPDGKIHSRNVYAATNEECEVRLAGLVQRMKAEIAEAKRLVSEGKWEEAMALAGQKRARGTRKEQLQI